MLKKGSTREFFLGNNTNKGFYSYFGYILEKDNYNYLYCIKGGPGTGKSSFMRKIGNRLINEGYDVEFAHCSSDPNSLDGLIIPSAGIAFVDATAPHVMEPQCPGANGEIIHLGKYWNSEGLRKNRQGILENTVFISDCFKRAYLYLEAAGFIYKDMFAISYDANLEIESFINDELTKYPIVKKSGNIRKLFASAITPFGLINYLDSLSSGNKVYLVKGNVNSDIFMEEILRNAVTRGMDCEVFYCSINPDRKIDHILIKPLNIFIASSNKYHAVINHTEVLDVELKESKIETQPLSNNQEFFENLLYKAVANINQAKKAHDILEKYYIDNMDFDAVNEYSQQMSDRILMEVGDRKK